MNPLLAERPGPPLEEPREVPGRLAEVAREVAWWCVLALVLVPPMLTTNPTILGIGKYPLTADQVDLPRAVLLAVTSWLGLAAWGLAEWRRPEGIRWSRLGWLLVAFLALAGVSALASPARAVVFTGRWFHYEGLLQFWSYGAACFVAMQTVTRKRLVTVIRYGSMVGAVLAVYGLLQAFGLDKANWLYLSWPGGRAFGTWANPDFFGGYLLFPLTFSIALVMGDEDRRWRVAGGVSLALTAVALVMTLTRGAWLAGMLAATLMLACLVRRGLPWRRTLAVALVALLVAGTAAFVITDGKVVNRALNAFKAGDDGVGGRLDIWRESAHVAFARPLLGSGPDTYQLAMAARLSSRMPVIPDDPHDGVLYLLITLGVPATLAAVGFVASALSKGAGGVLGVRATDMSSLPLAAIWSASAAHVAFLMLSPSVAASTTLLFASLGVLLAAGTTRAPSPRGLREAATVVAAAVAVVAVLLGARGIAADHAYLRSRIAAHEGGDRLQWAERAVEFNPLNDRYQLELEQVRAGAK